MPHCMIEYEVPTDETMTSFFSSGDPRVAMNDNPFRQTEKTVNTKLNDTLLIGIFFQS